MLEIVIEEVLWSIRGSYQIIWSFPLTNVKWHLWPDHIQWQHPTDQTLYRTRPFTEFWVVSIEYLRRVWHADRGRLLLRTPGPVPLGLAFVLLVETSTILYRLDIIPVCDIITGLNLIIQNLTFYQILVSIEHLQRVWLANRGRLLLRTPGPVPLGLAYILLVETNPFPNLSLFYRTMLFGYPSVLSRFCLLRYFRLLFFDSGTIFDEYWLEARTHFPQPKEIAALVSDWLIHLQSLNRIQRNLTGVRAHCPLLSCVCLWYFNNSGWM